MKTMKINNQKWYFLALYIIMCQNVLFGQWENYNYQIPIEHVSETWHELEIPEYIYPDIRKNNQDLRIFGVNELGDTLEIPYILRKNESKLETTSIPFNTINETHNQTSAFFTFEIQNLQGISEIQLDFENENFEWKIKLEGSNDQKEWVTILEDYRIVGIKNDLTNYQFTKLKFEEVKYQFFRLSIPLFGKPRLNFAKIFKKKETLGKVRERIVPWTYEEKKEQKQTVLTLNLGKTTLISKLEVLIDLYSEYDYYRNFTLEYITDSVKTEKGTRYQYGFLKRDVLSSFEKNKFEFKPVIAKKLRLTVDNQDNMSLEYEGFEISGNIHSLVARFPKEKGRFYFVYGNKKAVKPNYDLVNFQNKIPNNLKLLNLGIEEKITHTPKPETTPLFENKFWLWGLMLLAIGILGWFTYGMMKTAD